MPARQNVSSRIVHDTPVPSHDGREFWGSDAIADTLRALRIRYLALNPGSSYRGLHDSLVNHLGNRDPQIILTLHEEAAAGIAHGYWKVSGEMMAVAVHANVGLMHASMAIFDAWCDRAPVLVLGGTGPWDAAKRGSWIDWTHTTSDQAALVRGYTKWDNQPGSITAAVEAVLRGSQIAQTAPRGPVYIAFDAGLQEQKLPSLPTPPEASRFAPPPMAHPDPSSVEAAARLLSTAKKPLMLAGRCTRNLEGWNARIALAEKLNMHVLTSLKMAASFPTDHRLHAGTMALQLSPNLRKFLAEADVILSLDWFDLAGFLKQIHGENRAIPAEIIQISCDAHNHRGWSMDHHALAPADTWLMCEPEAAVPLLLAASTTRPAPESAAPTINLPPRSQFALNLRDVSEALEAATQGIDVCYTHLPLGWRGGYLTFRHPLDFIGPEGGGGVGAGPGITIGAALALQGSGRLPIGLLGDGDFLMGHTAIWTAAHYRIPCLIIVCNNRAYYSDEVHQESVATTRGRPTENRWIGQHLTEPDIDLAAIARAQGATALGPITTPAELQAAIGQGITITQQGGVCVIDVRVQPGRSRSDQ